MSFFHKNCLVCSTAKVMFLVQAVLLISAVIWAVCVVAKGGN